MTRTNGTLGRAARPREVARTARCCFVPAVPARLSRRRRDEGSITLWVAVTFAAVLAVAALVADGGARIRAGERADIVAGEAARAASYATGPDAVTRTAAGEAARAASYATGPDAVTRTAAASTAARGILSRSGLSGTVAVVGPGKVDIAVQASANGPITGYTYTVTRNATAQLLLGVGTGGAP